MVLINTSQYSDDIVKTLVEFACVGIDTTKVVLRVKNSSRPFRSKLYPSIPKMSSLSKRTDIEVLITIGIGSPHLFPVTTAGMYGVRAPVLTITSWQEALIAAAAHEAKHAEQTFASKPQVDAESEAYASQKLTAYRRLRRIRKRTETSAAVYVS